MNRCNWLPICFLYIIERAESFLKSQLWVVCLQVTVAVEHKGLILKADVYGENSDGVAGKMPMIMIGYNI